MKKNTLENLKIIDIPKVHEERGKIAVIEKGTLPYKIKRVYYLYDIPSDAVRGGHAHKKLNQCLIALSGSFDVVLNDGKNAKVISLNKPNIGLLIPNGIWREVENFSSGAVCLVLASEEFDEADYIREFKVFKESKFNTK